MNHKIFCAVADILLKTHYGIGIDDTYIADLTCFTDGERPYQAVNEVADKEDLTRIDVQAAFGTPSLIPLTMEQELAALEVAVTGYLLDEAIVHCPLCGSRTNFDEISNNRQHHRCLEKTCGNEFIAEPDTEEAVCN